MSYNETITHYKTHWGEPTAIQKNPKNPKEYLNNDFSICIYQPNMERKYWIYATCGLSSKNPKNSIELFMYSSLENKLLIDILYAISDYHITGAKLDVNHSVNFGISLTSNSNCSYGLLSYPYIENEQFFINSNSNTKFIWLLPITKEEREYKNKFGIGKLEQKFEVRQFNYLDFNRISVV